jgi:hypothetical protein
MKRSIYAIATFTVFALVGFSIARGIGSRQGAVFQVAAAQAAEAPAYTFANIDLTYPFGRGLDPPSKGLLGVSYDVNWAQSSFPGTAECQLVALDAAGAEVGRLDFLGSFAEPGRFDAVAVEVSGEPVSVEASCGRGTYNKGAEMTVRTRGTPVAKGSNSSEVPLIVDWASGIDPGIRACTLTADLTGGQSVSVIFELVAPNGTQFREPVPAPAEDIMSTSVACRPI